VKPAGAFLPAELVHRVLTVSLQVRALTDARRGAARLKPMQARTMWVLAYKDD
jgi:hypothetical protein